MTQMNLVGGKYKKIATRLQKIRDLDFGGNASEMGRSLGLDKSAMSRALNGKYEKPVRVAATILIEEYGYNQKWIEDGVGERKVGLEPAPTGSILETFLCVAPCAIAMFDLHSNFLLATDAFVRGFRLEKHAPLAGKYVLDVFDTPNASAAETARRAEAGDCPTSDVPTMYTLNDGTKVFMTFTTKNWYRDDGSRGGYYVVCFFGSSSDRAVQNQAAVLNNIGKIDIVAEAETLEVYGDNPQEVTIQSYDSFEKKISTSEIRALVERIVTSSIDWRAVQMVLERLEGQSFKAANLTLVKEHEGEVYEISFSANVRKVTISGSDKTAPKQKDPPPDESRS